jgi:hypothetical protein
MNFKYLLWGSFKLSILLPSDIIMLRMIENCTTFILNQQELHVQFIIT